MKECYFWKDDWCAAKSIEVAPRQGTRDAYFEAGTIGATQPAVSQSIDTQCVTFRPRGSSEEKPQQREEPASARSGREAGPRPRTER